MTGFDWNWLECEYCGREDVVLYGWQGDVWCGKCIIRNTTTNFLRMTGTLEEAPVSRPQNITYEQPYIFQTPDRKILRGIIQPE